MDIPLGPMIVGIVDAGAWMVTVIYGSRKLNTHAVSPNERT